MKQVHRKFALFSCVVFGLWLGLSGRVTPASTIDVTPAGATIFVGQSQQFTANGALGPTALSAGGEYTCVRLPDGTVRCTGRNQWGQLANGTTNNSSVLVGVSDLAGATRVAAGDEFACALLGDGTAKCWGLGESGQHGDGTFAAFALVPVAVTGITSAVDITSGYGHACALLGDGTIRCWGLNANGQLGDSSTQPRSAVPVAVSGINSAVAITAGADHACALLQDSTLRCWGKNGQGQLGDGTLTSSSTAVPVAGITGVAAVSGGGIHTCAVLTDGTVQCWGGNDSGQLGDG